jgi:hypothetical protein
LTASRLIDMGGIMRYEIKEKKQIPNNEAKENKLPEQ